jgi:hypothetical protein
MMKLIAFISTYIITWLRLLPSGGVRAIAAENIMLRQQLIALSRNHKRAPRLMFFDKIIFGILTSMMSLKQLTQWVDDVLDAMTLDDLFNMFGKNGL